MIGICSKRRLIADYKLGFVIIFESGSVFDVFAPQYSLSSK